MQVSRTALHSAALAVSLLFTSNAFAQNMGGDPLPDPVGPSPMMAPAFGHHQGVMVGFGLGLSTASASCDGCTSESEGGVGLDFHVGGFLNPRLALMYDVGAWGDSENDITLVLMSHTFAAQYWVAPRVWIKGGVGMSVFQISNDIDSDSEEGTAFTAGVGYEITTGPMAMDISGRLSVLSFDNDVRFTTMSALFGFRWK